MHYLGICAIIKDEDPFLDEWIAYHMHLGVDAFHLYDNGSRIPLQQSLRKFDALRSKAAITIYSARGKRMQMLSYNNCCRRTKEQCRWIAFIDVDEYIVPGQHDSIPGMLKEFEPYAGLAMNWKSFGTGGHKLRPAGLQLENYTRALSDGHSLNTHVKSIVNPSNAKVFLNPHICILYPGAPIVTEKHIPITHPRHSPPSWDKGQINHYVYRSKQDFFAKLQRPRADSLDKRRLPEDFVLPEGDVTDTRALRFVDGVKAILAQTA